MVQGEIVAVEAAWVDEANPDTNNHGGDLPVRSEELANRRVFVAFDLDEKPDNFDAWEELQVILRTKDRSLSERILEMYELGEGFDETTLTWNNQPGPGDFRDSDSNEFSASFEFTWVLHEEGSGFATEGLVFFRILDDTEDDSLGVENLYYGRHSEKPPKLVFSYHAAEERDLASSLVVRQVQDVDLDAAVLPRIQAAGEIGTALEVVYKRDLVATVAPSLSSLGVRARVQGIVTRLFLEPLEEFRRISDEAGSVVTRVQDGETTELRCIVQVVASGTPAFSLSETPTFPGTDTGTPETLRRGDAILFALGTDRWDPGARVTWDRREYVVAGVLGVERIEDEVLYQEVGLRRVSVTVQGRAAGVIA